MGLPLFSTRQCVIVPAGDVPMCAKVGEQHFIFLKTKDNHWCQWVYQFAHEYFSLQSEPDGSYCESLSRLRRMFS